MAEDEKNEAVTSAVENQKLLPSDSTVSLSAEGIKKIPPLTAFSITLIAKI